MKILITGAAGFIGAALAKKLLERGDEVVGVDNLNDYYDVKLKQARLARLRETGKSAFSFSQINIADKDAILALADTCKDAELVVNFAAQAGVRYSIVNPFAYAESNVMGFIVMLELARRLPRLRQFVYASSSSVYGGNAKIPFSIEDPVEKPISVYAATKRSDELLAYSYAHLHKIPCTGLRFFTVYGPWGRPDMAAYLFTSKILAGTPLPVYNYGKMRRDFTYIDDAIAGTIGAMERPVSASDQGVQSEIFNIGNSRTEMLTDYIGEIEKALGQKAVLELLPMQPGDVPETYADIKASQEAFGYAPKTTISEGIPRFVDWYKKYHSVQG
ncbi:MAG: NAD-dependent epimerase/dehydratase family protein [Alphaproteobacteria bacterium]|nr:NAD-dependent epimerase/dehydratase family protein [Alphaproteobacteria bacterium]